MHRHQSPGKSRFYRRPWAIGQPDVAAVAMWLVHMRGGGMMAAMATRPASPSTEHMIAHVRELIGRGHLRTGDRLPPERLLVTQLGVSRPTVRAALRALAAMGVVEARHGSGTYIPG